MSVMKFQEYLDHKNKLQTTPKLEKVPDYNGPQENKPVGHNKPYTPSNSPVKPQKAEKGFGDEGGSDLVYNPKTEPVNTKEVGTWPKTKMQEWLEKTKGLSFSDFTAMVRKDAKIDECACQEAMTPTQAVKYIAGAIKTNESLRANLVREIKKSGSMGILVAEMMQYNETYAAIVKLMENENGERVCRKLVKEMVAPPIHRPAGSHKKPMDDMEMPPEEEGEEDLEMGDEEDMEGEEDLEGMEGEEEMPMDGEEMPPENEMGDEELPPPPPPKRKRRKAHHNMMQAMQSVPSDMGMGM